LPVPTPAQKEYSDETARMVDEEIKKLLNDAHVKVRDLLGVHRQALEELAKLLLEKEVVDRPELLAILKVRSIGSLKDKDKTQRREQPHMRDDRPT
jgi:ATP-dependent Zn protease